MAYFLYLTGYDMKKRCFSNYVKPALPDPVSERWGHPADEPSQVRHDGGHGHADQPQRGFGPLQPAPPLLLLDDLRQ